MSIPVDQQNLRTTRNSKHRAKTGDGERGNAVALNLSAIDC
jgi:hypothetical protein